MPPRARVHLATPACLSGCERQSGTEMPLCSQVPNWPATYSAPGSAKSATRGPAEPRAAPLVAAAGAAAPSSLRQAARLAVSTSRYLCKGGVLLRLGCEQHMAAATAVAAAAGSGGQPKRLALARCPSIAPIALPRRHDCGALLKGQRAPQDLHFRWRAGSTAAARASRGHRSQQQGGCNVYDEPAGERISLIAGSTAAAYCRR